MVLPVEAMASGLPVIVSDWDGYKETVRDGVDGFRIPTEHLVTKLTKVSSAICIQTIDYDTYLGLTFADKCLSHSAKMLFVF